MSQPSSDRGADVLGEFIAVGVLGEGGSGTVYDARWGHRQVALKVMRAELPASERDRFLAEARLLMEITHPGVVKVLAAGTLPDGRPYLAMELLRGEALAARLARAPIPLAGAIALFAQLADAVSAMHARGLLHRDLKPENVMLVSDGVREHAVLLDFGIARAMERGEVAPTQTGIVRGTPAYMAPERFFGQPATVATDVYELAVTLYAMIAGRLPWEGCIDPEVRLNPVRLADVAAVPPALDAELARALSTRAGNRPPTVDALRDAVLTATGAMAAAVRQTADLAPLPLARTVAAYATPQRPSADAMPAALIERPSPNGMPAWTGGLARSVTTGNAAGERPPTAAIPARRRRWPWIAAGTAVIAAAVATPLALRDGERRAATTTDDPWDTPVAPRKPPPGPERPVVPLEDDERAALRRELAQASRHAADDLRSVIGVGMAELRADPSLAPAVAQGARSMVLGGMSEMLVGHCDFDLAGRARWLVLGIDERDDFDLIARGDWTRDEIEACLMTGRKGEPTRVPPPAGLADLGDAPITLIPLDGPDGRRRQPIGWLDEHTFVTTTRERVGVDYIAARLVGAPPEQPSALTRAVAGLDRAATIWMASNREGYDDVVEAAEVRGAALTARVTLVDDGADFAFLLTYEDAAAATAAHAYLEKQLAAIANGGMLSIALPGLVCERKGTVVRIAGQAPSGLLASLKDHLLKALP